jgi:hypothetical protein
LSVERYVRPCGVHGDRVVLGRGREANVGAVEVDGKRAARRWSEDGLDDSLRRWTVLAAGSPARCAP